MLTETAPLGKTRPLTPAEFASISGDVAVDDLYSIAIFRAAAASLRVNDHAPSAVEGIDHSGRSFDRSRSNSRVSGWRALR